MPETNYESNNSRSNQRHTWLLMYLVKPTTVWCQPEYWLAFSEAIQMRSNNVFLYEETTIFSTSSILGYALSYALPKHSNLAAFNDMSVRFDMHERNNVICHPHILAFVHISF